MLIYLKPKWKRSLFNNWGELQMLKANKKSFFSLLFSSFTAHCLAPFSPHLPPCCPFSSSFAFSSHLHSPHPQPLPPYSLPSSPQPRLCLFIHLGLIVLCLLSLILTFALSFLRLSPLFKLCLYIPHPNLRPPCLLIPPLFKLCLHVPPSSQPSPKPLPSVSSPLSLHSPNSAFFPHSNLSPPSLLILPCSFKIPSSLTLTSAIPLFSSFLFI
jgi:hypothetical protein